jgi:tRNA threonylcarbamoyladenosine biosynthesis protein TsaB
MKVLALESSGMAASAAILEDDKLLAEYTVNYKKTHSQTLLPMLDTIASMIDLDLSTVDAIAVSSGPGSFTGLRIGSATAKGLGLALDKPLIEVPTLDALAYNIYDSDKVICPIMDARRAQVYTGIYGYEKHMLKILEDQMAIPVLELSKKLNALGREVIFLGDGVDVYRDALDDSLSIAHSYAPAHVNRQRASTVGALGEFYYRQGRIVNADDHHPWYLREAQAERERKARIKEDSN